jgi:hypothetical protein
MNLSDLFTLTSLTTSINKLPLMPTRAGALGIFRSVPVNTTAISIDQQDGRLFLVPNVSRNAEPAKSRRDVRTVRTFTATHLPAAAVLQPNDLQNVRAFGQQNVLEGPAQVINERLQSMKNSIDATLEWQRVGALSGKILDADGSTITDLFTEFGATKATASFALGTATTKVKDKCLAAKRSMETKLGAVMVREFRAFCAPDFFDAFTGHALVKEAFANYNEAADRLGGDLRGGFTFGGIVWEEYNITVSGQKFIPDGTAKIFPVGPGIFETYYAPANYNETVNTLGQPYYAKAEERSMNKGWDLEAQSNPFTVCLYPEALYEATIS